ncbi:hypothetical protein BJY04DRAFT_230824 [Aspergillus karnatakaensis]|uniref:uncharacterized protein n=1 Tax=Aspergillus karnatakaensis TaxID=1810916 RepID=UPI003CCDAAC6
MTDSDKRQRVSLACLPCRKKKCRCDGRKPVCLVCDRDGRRCEYLHNAEKRKPPTKCYVHALHSRIALLEHQLAQLQGNQESAAAPVSVSGDLSQPPDVVSGSDIPMSGAYGHPSISYDRSNRQDVNGISIRLGVDGQTPPIFPSPEIQTKLLEQFFIWHNTWPVLVHEPLFRQDQAEAGAQGYCTPAVLSAVLLLSAQYTDVDQLQDWGLSIETLAEHAKGLLLGQLEHPSLSFVLSASLISLRELIVDNLASATQYVGLALRHAIFLGYHLEHPWSNRDTPVSTEAKEAQSMAWLGLWMLEKHIAQVMGQPSHIRHGDMHPIAVPMTPSVEYSPWPTADSSHGLTSHSMTNMQYACDLLGIVSAVLDKMHSRINPLTFQEKESNATQTHVNMSVFYNTLPSALRLPPVASKQLPPHVYQLNLYYHTLKIMVHSPLLSVSPSMSALQESGNQMVHLQSSTFSAIRISYIINCYKNFYPLNKITPFAVQSLLIASLMHIFNSNSPDSTLAKRSQRLHHLNLHFLSQMASTIKCSTRALDFLESFRNKQTEIPNNSTTTLPDLSLPVAPEITPDRLIEPTVDIFDWFQLPFNQSWLPGGEFEDILWGDSGGQVDGQGWDIGGPSDLDHAFF